MSQKSQTRLLVAISAAIITALGTLIAIRSSASLEGKKRSEALEALPNLDAEVAIASLALVAIALALYFFFGRNHNSGVDEAPRGASRNSVFAIQPAVLGRLTRGNELDADDITATILHLAQQGVLRITPTTRVNASGREIPDYLLERDGTRAGQPTDSAYEGTSGDSTRESASTKVAGAGQPTDPIERATLNLLFDIAGGGADSVLLGDIHSFGRHHFQDFTQAIASWQKTLTDEITHSPLFDKVSKKLQLAMAICAGAFILCGALMALATKSALPFACLSIAALTFALLAQRMPRTTQQGAKVLASAEALRIWLIDLGQRGSQSQAEVCEVTSDEWASLMPYAFVLGAASDTIDALAELNPDALVRGPGSYVPAQAPDPRAPEQAPNSHAGSDCETGYAPWVLWYSENLTATPVAREISNCICGTAFAAAATEATAQLRSLNSPVQGALSGGGLPEVGGINTGPSPASNRMR